MRIINGKRFYKKDMDTAKFIDAKGWDFYNGQNYQWYSLYYNPECEYVCLNANNSGDCYGDYKVRHFSSPQHFKNWCNFNNLSISELLGDVDENNEIAMQFVNAVYQIK